MHGPSSLDTSLSSYDAAYLSLASRMKVPLATMDQRLQQAATAEGVSILLSS